MRKNLRKWVLGAVFLLLISNFLPKMTEAKIYGTISGKIIAEDTGKGVKDAHVFLFPINEKTGHPMEPRIVETDEEGRFLFKNLSEGKYLLAVEPPPPYYGDTEYVERGKYNKVDSIILRKGGVVHDFVKVVKVGGSISGKVVKGDGTGFPDVFVSVWSDADLDSTKTTADGSYRIEGLAPSKEYQVTISIEKGEDILYHNEWSKVKKGIKIDAKEETKGVDFILDLDDPTGIEGIVTSTDGKPLEGASIDIEIAEGDNLVFKAATYTLEGGRYSLKGLVSGRGSVAAGYFRRDLQAHEFFYQSKEVYFQRGKRIRVDFILDFEKDKLQIRKNQFSSTPDSNLSLIGDPKILIDPNCQDVYPELYFKFIISWAYSDA
jgi:hypothetical protein